MNKISVNQEKSKRTGVKFSFQSMLMLMATIMMALVTLTACPVDDENEDDPDEIENGENGGVAGKRLKSTVQTTGPIDGSYRSELTYSDGTLKQSDVFDVSSKLTGYAIYTNNSDGTRNKMEFYDLSNSSEPQLAHVYTYSYDANKKPLQGKGIYYTNGTQYGTVTIDFTFQNGKKTGEKMTFVFGNAPYSETFTTTFAHNYDNNGRRTTTTETHSLLGARQYTRTYNSDGTLQKVTYPYGYGGSDNRTVTKEFTWENGKKTYDEDDFEYW